jgi:hypothetical protein
MEILDAHWTPKVNILKIQCDCGNQFLHRADKTTIVCPACKRIENCLKLKEASDV